MREAFANVCGRLEYATPCLKADRVLPYSLVRFEVGSREIPQPCDKLTYSVKGSSESPSMTLNPGARFGPLMVTSSSLFGFGVGVAPSLAEHFIWLEKQSSSHCLAVRSIRPVPLILILQVMVLTPGSTA